jgi:MOSC domain-containing protein YiiM
LQNIKDLFNMTGHVSNDMEGRILAVSISDKKGEKKHNIESAMLRKNHGMENDAHAGDWHRQVSLLAMESIEKIRSKGIDVHPGEFAENLTTEGIRLWELPVGRHLRIGESILAEVTQIGKECHSHCAIFQQVGDCVMPREGIFVKILEGGEVKLGDMVTLVTEK